MDIHTRVKSMVNRFHGNVILVLICIFTREINLMSVIYVKNRFLRKAFSLYIKNHIGYEPFKCGTCGKSFPQSSHLTRHKSGLIGYRPFYCKICNKSFAIKSHLSRHLSVHIGDKPYNCETCLKSFSQKQYENPY